MKIGVIYGAPDKYATPIRIKNLTHNLNTQDIKPRFWPNSKIGKLFVILDQCLQVLLPSFKPDIIIASAPLIASSIPALLCKKIKKTKVIFDWDDAFIDFSEHKPKFWELSFWEYLAIKKADHVIVVADKTKEIAETFGKKTTYIPNGVNMDYFDPKKFVKGRKQIRSKLKINEEKVIVFLGSINGNKKKFVGQDIIKASENVTTRKVKFLIIGDGPGLKYFKKEVKNKNLENLFIFTGQISHERIPEYLSAADVAIVPFDEKTFSAYARSSCKIKEFLAMNIPVITVGVGENLKDIKKEESGVLVHTNADLAKNFDKLLKRAENITNARKQAKKYSFKKLRKKFNEIISEVQKKTKEF